MKLKELKLGTLFQTEGIVHMKVDLDKNINDSRCFAVDMTTHEVYELDENMDISDIYEFNKNLNNKENSENASSLDYLIQVKDILIALSKFTKFVIKFID